MFRTNHNPIRTSRPSLFIIAAAVSALAAGNGLAAASSDQARPGARIESSASKRSTGKVAERSNGKDRQKIARGWLSGVVTDSRGNRVAEATLWISMPGGREIVEQTDWNGRFHIANLPDSKQAGHVYTIRAAHCDFGEGESTARVVGNADTSCSITLKQWPWMDDPSDGFGIIGWCPVGPDWADGN